MPVDFTRSHIDEWFCNVCSSGHVDYMNTPAAIYHERHSAEHAHNVAELETWWNPPAQDAAAWNAPIVENPQFTAEEIKMRECQMHVDHVQDMVPFWIRGVEAAEKGEVLKLEHFLETLQEVSNAWLRSTPETLRIRANSEGWGQWGEHGWSRFGGQNSAQVDAADAWGIGSTSSANGSNIRSDSQVRHKRQIPNLKERGRQRRQLQPRGDRTIGRERVSFNNAFDFVEHVAKQQSADEERKRRMHTFFDVR